jgi:trigger factor
LKVEQWRKVTSKSLLNLKAFTTKISEQMAQYGQTNPTDEEFKNCSTRFVKPRRSEKIIRSSGSGLLELFKENKPTTKVTY